MLETVLILAAAFIFGIWISRRMSARKPASTREAGGQPRRGRSSYDDDPSAGADAGD